MSTDLKNEIMQRHLHELQRVYTLPHNTKLQDSYQQWLEIVQNLQLQSPSELLTLCITLIESHQAALRISEYTIHYVQAAQLIVNLYRDNPTQRQEILQQLENIIQLGEPLFEKSYTYKEYASQGLSNIVDILKKTQKIWNVQTTYHQGEFQFPSEMLVLIDRYIEDLGPYRGLNDDERQPLLKAIQLEIVEKYPEETLNLFMLAIQKDEYFHYWLSKKLFFVLMEQKDKRLNHPDILEKLVQNFDLIIKKMIYAKPFILHLAFSIEKIAKANQLNLAIIEAIEKIQFTQYSTQSIPMKRLDQIQQKVKGFIQEFKQLSHPNLGETDNNITSNVEQYQLPFSNVTASQIWSDPEKISWPAKLQQQFDDLSNIEKQHWKAFWQHINANTAKKPSKKWLQEAQQILPTIQEQLLNNITLWFKFIIRTSPTHVRPFDSKNENTIKGILWFCIILPTDSTLLNLLAEFCQFCYQKISGLGATNGILGTTTIFVLSQHGQQGLYKLQDLQHILTYEAAKMAVQKALTTNTV